VLLSCSLLPDDPNASVAALGVSHGDLLFLAYDMERQVEPAYKPGPLDSNRPFGSHVSVSPLHSRLGDEALLLTEALSAQQLACRVARQLLVGWQANSLWRS